MEYIRFGSGKKTLVFLPGLGDGLRSVKGTALFMALLYHKYAKDYTAYMFSRKRDILPGSSTRDMAADQKKAMDLLGVKKADIIGVSMGGMIAQHLAADFPESVDKLVLVVTTAGQNPQLVASVDEWLRFARADNHRGLMDSNLKLIYSEKYYRNNKWLVPILGTITKPKSYERFFRQAEACYSHDSRAQLPLIKAATLIIGGKNDVVLGADASREIHAGIENSALRIYSDGYHGLYEEEKDFNEYVLKFLKS